MRIFLPARWQTSQIQPMNIKLFNRSLILFYMLSNQLSVTCMIVDIFYNMNLSVVLARVFLVPAWPDVTSLWQATTILFHSTMFVTNRTCGGIILHGIRERGSVLYLGMAKEISKYHTDAPAGKRPKKLLPPKPSMQTE